MPCADRSTGFTPSVVPTPSGENTALLESTQDASHPELAALHSVSVPMVEAGAEASTSATPVVV